MKEIKVDVVELKPMRMLSFYGYGEQPEDIAWEKAASWLKENTYKIIPDKTRIFGFNNPCPSAGSSKYGYEFLVSINEDVIPSSDMRITILPGGLYATATCQIEKGEEFPPYWKSLNAWCEESSYSFATHQWLEEHTIEGRPFAMFLPIKE